MNPYKFTYEVETSLWKDPFDKSITDEIEYKLHRAKNGYHDVKVFDDKNPLEARKKAFDYLQSMLEVLCESINVKFQNYWQAVHDLQPLLRADHPLAHRKVGKIQFDDDIFCGVSLKMRVKYRKRTDSLSLFDLGVYDDNDPHEIFTDILYSAVELGREFRYYDHADIEVEHQDVELGALGMVGMEMIPSLFDWQKFVETFKGCDIMELPNTDYIFDRMSEPIIGMPGLIIKGSIHTLTEQEVQNGILALDEFMDAAFEVDEVVKVRAINIWEKKQLLFESHCEEDDGERYLTGMSQAFELMGKTVGDTIIYTMEYGTHNKLTMEDNPDITEKNIGDKYFHEFYFDRKEEFNEVEHLYKYLLNGKWGILRKGWDDILDCESDETEIVQPNIFDEIGGIYFDEKREEMMAVAVKNGKKVLLDEYGQVQYGNDGTTTTRPNHSPIGYILMDMACHFHLAGYRYNETSIRAEMVEPILKSLRYDVDFDCIAREEKCGRSSRLVDYAIYWDKDCKFIIEVKALNQPLDDKALQQLMYYLSDPKYASAKYGILTNGRSWAAYNHEGQLIHAINLPMGNETEFYAIEEMVDTFFQYLRVGTIDREDMPQTDAQIDSREPVNFKVKIGDKTIQEKDAAKTLYAFINQNLELVHDMWKRYRFNTPVLSKRKPKQTATLSTNKVDGKRYWIITDSGTWQKIAIAQRVLWENAKTLEDSRIVVPVYEK